MRQNSPELWDELWEQTYSQDQDRFALAKEGHSVRWRRIERIIRSRYPDLRGVRAIELGAGSGTVAALLAKAGANITILDYSERALQRGREFFARNGLDAEFVNQNALALQTDLINQFDISLSFGLAEHFRGPDRKRILQAHLDTLKPGGWTFISVPNKFCPPYRLFKFVAQRTGKWVFGEEYPFSRGELLSLARQLHAAQSTVLGGSLGASFDFVNPFKAFAVVRRLFRLSDNLDPTRLRGERGTFLDAYLAYALVLAAQKPSRQ